MPSRALPRLTLASQPEHEVRAIREYFEWQGHEKVVHLEKVASERVLGVRHDVWDVHVASGRWWVVTGPTNLYSQADFPSLDYILSFHVGLMARVASRRAGKPGVSDEEQNRLAAAWRRWEQAVEAVDAAEEAEDFQAVGMRCRECLLELVRATARPDMVPPGTEEPKRADFIHWAELIADSTAAGSSTSELRGYLKSASRAAWQFVNWLTHAKNATRFDAALAADMTQHLLSLFGTSVVRHERGTPDRCPKCGSYQLGTSYRPDLDTEQPYRAVCARCEWTDAPRRIAAHKKKGSPRRSSSR